MRKAPASLLVVGPYPPVIGGTAAMLNRLVPALEEAGMACRVLNTGVGDRQGGALERLRRLLFFLGLAGRVLVARERIVHCHAVNFANLVGNGLVLAACRLAGKRSVITLHAGDLQAKFAAGRSRRLGAFILRLARVVTTVTPELSETATGMGIRHSRFIANDLRYVPYGDEGDDTLPDEVELFLTAHHPVVVLVGAMNPPYGVDVCLRALAALRRTHRRAGALIVAFKSNNVRYEEEIAALRRELDLESAALFPRPFANVAGALRRCDLFVRPTLSDGDSIAVREALTLGLPVVASAVGFRPDGVVTFPVGDHEAMTARIVETLAAPAAEPLLSEDSERRTVAQFLAAFEQAAGG